MSHVPKFYDVRLACCPLILCSACVAVLVQEGSVAGDPREASVPASDVVRMAPRSVLTSDPKPPTCVTCTGREAYEEALNASRAECLDAAFGTPEEHARWHAAHDTPTTCDGCAFCNARNIHCAQCPACTPTLAELEGEDSWS